MGIFDIGSITKKLQEAGEGIAKTVSDAADKISEIKPENVADAVKNAAQKGQDAINSIMPGAKENDRDNGEEKPEATEGKETDSDAENNEQFDQELAGMINAAREMNIPDPEENVTVQGAMQIVYALMAVDGKVSPEEEERFLLIGNELDSEFPEHKEAIVNEFTTRIQDTGDKEEYYDLIHDYVSETIRNSKEDGKTAGIRGKLLYWDLLTVGCSDSVFSDEERRLLRYICRTLRIDKSVAMEMEHTIKTLMTIEREEEWLKDAERPFRLVEERLKELADRKQTIMQSIYALISD